jgi:hypothetical protein
MSRIPRLKPTPQPGNPLGAYANPASNTKAAGR